MGKRTTEQPAAAPTTAPTMETVPETELAEQAIDRAQPNAIFAISDGKLFDNGAKRVGEIMLTWESGYAVKLNVYQAKSKILTASCKGVKLPDGVHDALVADWIQWRRGFQVDAPQAKVPTARGVAVTEDF